VFVLVDARHGLKPVDDEIMSLLDGAGVTFQIVLTKADKVTPKALAYVIAATEAALKRHPAAFPEVLSTSSDTGLGLEALRSYITQVVEERG
jgi:GTP-binding protein